MVLSLAQMATPREHPYPCRPPSPFILVTSSSYSPSSQLSSGSTSLLDNS